MRPEILKYFDYEHLPPRLQAISKPFHTLAHGMWTALPDNQEKSVVFRKLLEAKDAAVRSQVSPQ